MNHRIVVVGTLALTLLSSGLVFTQVPAGDSCRAAAKFKRSVQQAEEVLKSADINKSILVADLKLLDVILEAKEPNKIGELNAELANEIRVKLDDVDLETLLACALIDMRLCEDPYPRDKAITPRALSSAIAELVLVTFTSVPDEASVSLFTRSNSIGTTQTQTYVSPGKVRVFAETDKAGYEAYDKIHSIPKKSHTVPIKLKKK